MKKYLVVSLLIIAGVFLSSNLCAQNLPEFLPGQPMQFSNGAALVPGGTQYYSVPCVVDWNGDGNKDLLGGYFYSGWVYEYINVGSNSQPQFSQGTQASLQAGGVTLSVGYG